MSKLPGPSLVLGAMLLGGCASQGPAPVGVLHIRPTGASRAIVTVLAHRPLILVARRDSAVIEAPAMQVRLNREELALAPEQLAVIWGQPTDHAPSVDGKPARGASAGVAFQCSILSLPTGLHSLSFGGHPESFRVTNERAAFVIQHPREGAWISATVDTAECPVALRGFSTFSSFYRSPKGLRLSADSLSWQGASTNEVAAVVPGVRTGAVTVRFRYVNRGSGDARFSIDQIYGAGPSSPDRRTVFTLPPGPRSRTFSAVLNLTEAAWGIRLHFYNVQSGDHGLRVTHFVAQVDALGRPSVYSWQYPEDIGGVVTAASRYSVFVGTEQQLALALGQGAALPAAEPVVLLSEAAAASSRWLPMLSHAAHVAFVYGPVTMSGGHGAFHVPLAGRYHLTALVRPGVPAAFAANFASRTIRLVPEARYFTVGGNQRFVVAAQPRTAHFGVLTPTLAVYLNHDPIGYLQAIGATACGLTYVSRADATPGGYFANLSAPVRANVVPGFVLLQGGTETLRWQEQPLVRCPLDLPSLVAAGYFGTFGGASARVDSRGAVDFSARGEGGGAVYFILGTLMTGTYEIRIRVERTTGLPGRLALYADGAHAYLLSHTLMARGEETFRFFVHPDSGAVVLYFYSDGSRGLTTTVVSSLNLTETAMSGGESILFVSNQRPAPPIRYTVQPLGATGYTVSRIRGSRSAALVTLNQIWDEGWETVGGGADEVSVNAYAKGWFVQANASSLGLRYTGPRYSIAIAISVVAYLVALALALIRMARKSRRV